MEKENTNKIFTKEFSLSNVHIKSLIDQMEDSVYFKDTESRFILVNNAFLKKHSFQSANEVLGKTDFDIFADKHAKLAFENEQKIMRTGQPMLNVEEKETWSDGAVTWVSSSKMPLYNEAGKVIGTCGISRDITDRIIAEEGLAAASQQLVASEQHIKEQEEAIRQSEIRLVQAKKLESLGLLAGGIAHDFNNLLTMIRCHLELAAMEVEPESNAVKSIKDVWPVLDRAAELTEHLLMYSGRHQVTLQCVVLSDFVRKTVDMIKASAGHVEIRFDAEDNLPMIKCDVNQIQQVAMNLIMNAIDAIGEKKGTVTVSVNSLHCAKDFFAGNQYVNKMPAGDYVCMIVKDDGCGMDRDMQSRIFDPFFTTKKRGKGLGLAAILGIMKGHQGAVIVDSKLGEGTTFKVLFPVVEG